VERAQVPVPSVSRERVALLYFWGDICGRGLLAGYAVCPGWARRWHDPSTLQGGIRTSFLISEKPARGGVPPYCITILILLFVVSGHWTLPEILTP